MSTLAIRLATYRALGLPNLVRVATYRMGLRYRLHPVLRARAELPSGPFFSFRPSQPPPGAVAREDWCEDGNWFGIHNFGCDTRPDWHANPFNGARSEAQRHWSAVPDFDPAVGDIKTVWEASRFDWALAMAQRAALGDVTELDRLNAWLNDWVERNPPYNGANWKCGQEASIRVMHLALAAILLDQVDASLPSLDALVRLHLQRIAPTIGYAIGQQNNHGTSEAAALFIGGSWLARHGCPAAARWMRIGRRQLEARGRELIAPDGTFSQYSLVYHRLMLDSYALGETWRRRFGLPAFSDKLFDRLGAATRWLQQLVNVETGDGPNVGANDGAWLMRLSRTDFRDFRPSLQWASALFLDRLAFARTGPWDQPLLWLGLPRPDSLLNRTESMTFDDGGLHVLRAGRAVAYLRYPRFRFRPSQADALHLDLWIEGENWLRDAGSYSYNSSPDDSAYFSGVIAHNTVQFDTHDQMPRLGRFLFGAWLEGRGVRAVESIGKGVEAAAAYRDHWGAEHRRTVRLEGSTLRCTDHLSGNAKTAVLRWRLKPGGWRLSGRTLTNGRITLTIHSDDPKASPTLSQGWESRYYLEKTTLPVLEVAVRVPATIQTQIDY